MIEPVQKRRKPSLGAANPKLAQEWHPTKNGTLTANDITPGSQKKVWWLCPEGADHEWQAVVSDRNKGIGCAICSNYKVVRSNSLATLNPDLAREWHPTRNGALTPYDIHPGSAKKLWWKCAEGEDHEWQAVVHSRNNGKGCPICSGRQLAPSTSLAKSLPELAREWHPIKNGSLTPNDVTSGSRRKVWWKCPKGEDHAWQATVYGRAKGLGCPICSNQKIVLSNCLATVNPELAKEWHPVKNGKLTPYEVGAGSGKVVWWKCPQGDDHEWKASVARRKAESACPICRGRRVVPSNSLAAVFPDLSKEWHQKKNKTLMPSDVRPGSTIRVWWSCTKNPKHEWKTSVKDRTQGTGCPICNPQTSAPELRIYSELKTLFPSTKHRVRIRGYEVDVFVPELSTGIEYDGQHWHKDKIDKDKEKNEALKDELFLIRLREKGLPKLASTDIVVQDRRFSKQTFNQILHTMILHRRLNSTDAIRKVNEYLSEISWKGTELFVRLQLERNHVDYESSLSRHYPNLVEEWHPTKNGKLRPEQFTPGSEKKIWWKCPKGADHEWVAGIDSRTRGRGCPVCRGRKVVQSNCLATLYPELSQQWHPIKNKDLTPTKVTPGSEKRVWWKDQLGKAWAESIRARVLKWDRRKKLAQLELDLAQ